ncbi:unnamed protein product [Pleuronectes platessa]|uniref:Uncharacterized protein n=1 Tax=Pleuronectes platessa TaxID=8262 RepID=A0A9N7VTN2_PLEPL|nr:unnamed protein product [Pleuronectes platessa]
MLRCPLSTGGRETRQKRSGVRRICDRSEPLHPQRDCARCPRDQNRVSGRTEPGSCLCIPAEKRVTFSPSWRPSEGEGGSSVFRRARSRVRRMRREPTAKQVVTLRLIVNCLRAAVVRTLQPCAVHEVLQLSHILICLV